MYIDRRRPHRGGPKSQNPTYPTTPPREPEAEELKRYRSHRDGKRSKRPIRRPRLKALELTMAEYHGQIWALRSARGARGLAAHALWWVTHNCVAHPLLGLLPGERTVRLHDWTSDRLNLRREPSRSPAPRIPSRRAWLLHNCVAHPLMGLVPLLPAFAWHDETAEAMDVDGWA